MESENTLFSFAAFAHEIVRMDNRLEYLFRKWLCENSRGWAKKDFRDMGEIIRIPVPEELSNPEEASIRVKEILMRPIIVRDINGKKTNRVVIEMPRMNFIL